ncbi:myb-binding protein 1A-like protein [Maniola hyperantus]|uniref:myb-binding protein 1A-like protein n=1 Tax=Aphantopus hyperantus TaxID=2795564 RepID=UPI00156845B1|nr:myb-binding protein 1A-like protein [Maniola hyperantus]
MNTESSIDDPQKEIISIKEITSLLDAFDFLKSPKDGLKVTGGLKIFSRLHENENEKNLQYTLKRLIRSLGANVPELRMGHFATLVCMLTRFNQITVSQLLDLVKKELHASGSSKSEIGDVALGQILVCCAVFRSGLMLKSSDEEQIEVMQLLQTASNKKNYLHTVASLIVLDLVNQLNEDQFATIVWSNIKQEYKKDIKDHTLDSLYFLMLVSAKFPQKVKLRKLIGVPEILHEDHINDICEKLMTGVDFNSVSHPIYKEIGVQIAKSPHIQLFWNKIDGYLVKHNRNRELVSLNILNSILLNLQENVEVIPDLLSDNFFKLFMDWFKGLQTASKIRNKRDDEDDNKIMITKQKEVLLALTKALKNMSVDSKIRVATLKKLLFHPGEINFTEITGSTVVKSIIADLDADGLKKIAKVLKKVLLNTSKKVVKENIERNWYNNEKVKASELISFIVSHEAVKDDTDFKITYMQLLMCFGFFKIGGDDNVAVSSELAGSIKTSFYRCFTSRFSNVNTLVEVLSSLNTFISNKMTIDQVREKLEKQFPKENMECWEMLTEVCQKIEKKEPKSKVDKVFLILLYQLGLFLFSEPTHVKIARSSIIELKSCYNHYKKKLKKHSKLEDSSINDEPEWIEVMVEVLLSVLSIESSVLRSVVQCVFRLLWEYLTPSSIGQIVSVLDPDSEANPLTRDSESEEEEDDDTSEVAELEADENTEPNGEVSDDSDSEMEDEDQDDDLSTPDQLRLAVQKALGTAAAPDTDTESADADMLTEEEGKKLDDALADAFKQFHQGKNKKSKKDRKNKKSLADFRIRVLDLIDIYLEKAPAMDICLGMIVPLTRCLEFCMQDNQFKELENRLRKTVKSLTTIRKFTSTGDVTVKILEDYLKSIIDKGERSHFMYQALGDIITFFAVFIIHCSQKLDAEVSKSPKKQKRISPIVETFKVSLENYFRNRNCLLPIIFFHNVLQTEWEGKYKLIPILIKNVFDNTVRQFRRNEGVHLLIGFYQTLNRCKPSSEATINEISNIVKYFHEEFAKLLKSENEVEMKFHFVAKLKKLLQIMDIFHQKYKIETDLKSMLDSLASVKTIKVKHESTENPIKTNGLRSRKKKKNKRKKLQINGEPLEPEVKKLKTDSYA